MDTVQIVNVLLTRRCNLRCSYCRLVRDYEDMPLVYNDMKYYYRNELTGDQWISIINRIIKNNPKAFFIFYGGEPFLYDDLWKIINHCNKNKIYYTIISNNTDVVQEKIKDVFDKVGIFRGFTSSVDPIAVSQVNEQLRFKEENKDRNAILNKSINGLRRLVEMKTRGMVEDAVAEITVMKSTVKYLYDTVKILTANGIYASITTLDDPKNDYYDFANVNDLSEMVEPTEEVKSMFDKIKNDKTLLVHMPDMLDNIFNVLPSNYHCSLDKDVHNLTIDSNGRCRLCLRINGSKTKDIPFNDVIDEDGKITSKFKKAIATDYNNYCNGCNWTCVLMSSTFSNQIIDHNEPNNQE